MSLIKSGAIFSPCREFRYTLSRVWDRDKGRIAFIGLNPSTADEFQDDPTIRRCINFAKLWGYGGMTMLNIFAYRATDPKVMKAHAAPVGDFNDGWIRKIAGTGCPMVAAWGVHGTFKDRGQAVIDLFPSGRLQCLGVTKDGHPKHPLYLRGDSRLMPFTAK